MLRLQFFFTVSHSRIPPVFSGFCGHDACRTKAGRRQDEGRTKAGWRQDEGRNTSFGHWFSRALHKRWGTGDTAGGKEDGKGKCGKPRNRRSTRKSGRSHSHLPSLTL